MKFCTKTQDLLKAYNKATNDLLIELLERSGYSDTCFYKYENRKPKGCKSDEGTEFHERKPEKTTHNEEKQNGKKKTN